MEGSWTLSGVNHCGFLVGNLDSSIVHNITGDFSAGSINSNGDNIGSLVIGNLNECTVNYVRNMARFSGSPAISGISCAGVISKALNSDVTYIMNAMVGEISGTNDAGGLFSTIENSLFDSW